MIDHHMLKSNSIYIIITAVGQQSYTGLCGNSLIQRMTQPVHWTDGCSSPRADAYQATSPTRGSKQTQSKVGHTIGSAPRHTVPYSSSSKRSNSCNTVSPSQV